MTENDAVQQRVPLVLIVDEHEWSARSIESVLSRQGYAVVRCTKMSQAVEFLYPAAPDAVILEVESHDASGIELCSRLRAHSRVGANTPILMVTERPMPRSQRLLALSAGAWDVLHFPLDSEELIRRLTVFVRSKREADRLRENSLLDAASGLYSVQGLLRRVHELSLDAHRNGTALTCLAIGPEESWSEDERSQANQAETAEILVRFMNTVSRKSDTIGRLGETEFAVVAARTGPETGLRMAHRFRMAAESFTIREAGGSPLRIRVGCFVADDLRDHAVDPVEMLSRAAVALQRAQRDLHAPPICVFGQPYSVS
ncbi:MAG TPA: response regulator [Longimicrobiales bacterium]|nr:response regulator [Longimicrobiales bacterium]